MQQQLEVPEGASFAYEVTIRSLNEQLDRIGALDTKAGVLLAADGVLAGFLFGADSVVRAAPEWLGIIATATLILSLALALLGFANRNYEKAPAPVAVARRAAAPEDWLMWRFTGNVHRAIDVNAGKLRLKARLVGAAQGLLLVTILLFGSYLEFAIATHRL